MFDFDVMRFIIFAVPCQYSFAVGFFVCENLAWSNFAFLCFC